MYEFLDVPMVNLRVASGVLSKEKKGKKKELSEILWLISMRC